MKTSALIAAAFAAGTLAAAPFGELKVSADRIAGDRVTGALAATGHVTAVARPLTLRSESVTRSADGEYAFADPTSLTTCTNAWDDLHWQASGEVRYRDRKSVLLRNVWVRLWDVPVLWLPWWYYPMDTDYGWRVMPGYTSRWGGFLLTKYVYGICGSMDEGAYGLAGDTRFDLRTKNGVALGQSVRWNLGDWGRGKFKAYYAWDEDADRYDRHWASRHHWNYRNWGSTVPDDRYGLGIEHRADVTERDTLRVKASYYSDSHFFGDFLRRSVFGAGANAFATRHSNEAAWEHAESAFAAGVSVTGPLNEFYPGVARLPEFYIDVNPMPVASLPVNYESQTRVGYLDRDYAKYGTSSTSLPYRYAPGPWADYNAFRFDTYHRLTLPFKVADVLSVVPRVGLRGTWWSETGRLAAADGRAGETGDDAFRSIFEGGVTFAARGAADLGDGLTHVVEPYLDVLAQEAHVSGADGDERPYLFDSLDGSRDWLDQFAGRSRNLPYSWYGVTPGLRNAFRTTDGKGVSRTLLDLDVYCAVQFNDTSYTEGDRLARLVRHVEDPNYGADGGYAVPGARVRWMPAKDTLLSGRVEYDADRNEIAYGDLKWAHAVSDAFRYHVAYCGRDHRRWDYAASAYDPSVMRRNDFNRAHFEFLEVGFEHELCDAVAWSPYVRWDCREGEFDEVGAWIDLRTDCLGFRFSVSYENEFTRIDGTDYDYDWHFGFFIYLRALGPSAGNPFGD